VKIGTSSARLCEHNLSFSNPLVSRAEKLIGPYSKQSRARGPRCSLLATRWICRLGLAEEGALGQRVILLLFLGRRG
jgi:hypothetical protein